MDTEKSVGSILREKRQEQKVSLADVAKNTKIRECYLRALEFDQYEELPGDVFLRGMIRSYGNYLGLNGLELVNHYKATVLGVKTDDSSGSAIREVEHVCMQVRLKEKRDIGSGRGGFFDAALFSNRSVLLLLVLLIAALILATYFFLKSDEEPVTINNSIAASVNSEASADDKKLAVPIDNNVKVELTANGQCWLEVTSDGKNFYEGLLNTNDKKVFEASEKLVIKYGNIGVMQVIVNGKKLSYAGEHGVAVKTYTK
ncbi:MAG: helix-turn-helix domain-containing protein [Acidaminococcaceae bacterium]|nr:helix-turn-helix domain-containing protein [Acidaminococcaceae bacterium]